jgi:hypothetical protein
MVLAEEQHMCGAGSTSTRPVYAVLNLSCKLCVLLLFPLLFLLLLYCSCGCWVAMACGCNKNWLSMLGLHEPFSSW